MDAGDFKDVAVGVLADWQAVIPRRAVEARRSSRRGKRKANASARSRSSLRMSGLLETGGSHTLHEAIKAYVVAVKLTTVHDLRPISPYGLGQGQGRSDRNSVRSPAGHPVDRLKWARIKELLNIIAARPLKRTILGSRPRSRIKKGYASAVIKEFRAFLNWLHDARSFFGRKPKDYAVKADPHQTRHRQIGPVRRATYQPHELIKLFLCNAVAKMP